MMRLGWNGLRSGCGIQRQREAVIQVITQPRVNKNSLFAYTHTLRPNLYNDFRIGYHRIDFDTLNYFSVNGVTTVISSAPTR